MNDSTKVCRRCKQRKPLSDFYIRSGYKTPTQPGHWLSECKTCIKERDRVKQRPIKGDSGVIGEQLTIDKLRSVGIHTVKSRRNLFSHSDIVCWGCIPIEVKHAKLKYHRRLHSFTFLTTKRQQQRGFLADLVILVCEFEPDDHTFHIFDAHHPVFFIKGRIKHGFTFVPGQEAAIKHGGNRVVMTQPLMDAALDAWWMIENKRLEKSEILRLEG